LRRITLNSMGEEGTPTGLPSVEVMRKKITIWQLSGRNRNTLSRLANKLTQL
jgi:hypothetical protein